MTYKIRDFNKESGTVKVEYKDYPLLTITLPLDENHLYLEGIHLDNYILGLFPPVDEVRPVIVSQGIANSDNIEKLVEPIVYSLDEVKEIKKKEISQKIAKFETSNIEFNYKTISANKYTLVSLLADYLSLKEKFTDTVDFKTEDGTWLVLDLENMLALIRTITMHSQACITTEKILLEQIVAAKTLEEVTAINFING